MTSARRTRLLCTHAVRIKSLTRPLLPLYALRSRTSLVNSAALLALLTAAVVTIVACPEANIELLTLLPAVSSLCLYIYICGHICDIRSICAARLVRYVSLCTNTRLAPWPEAARIAQTHKLSACPRRGCWQPSQKYQPRPPIRFKDERHVGRRRRDR